MDHFILEIPNVLSKELCESITRRFENDPRKNHGYYSYSLNGDLVTRDKTNKELMITGTEGWVDIDAIFTHKTHEVFEEYMRLLKDKFDYGIEHHVYDREITRSKNVYTTNFPIQRIDKGGCYEWHHDGNSSKTYFVQVIFYLNTLEEDQGGYTEFIDGRKIKPEIGKVLIYPCSWTFPHTGNEVKRGSKYICTTTIGFN
jgi:quinol monooxygenase YgiN